jgi:hypothetical protein
MKRTRLKQQAKGPHEDLSFLPPYSDQAKYLLLADKFLSTNGHRNVVRIDSSKHFKRGKQDKGKSAA